MSKKLSVLLLLISMSDNVCWCITVKNVRNFKIRSMEEMEIKMLYQY